MNSNSTLQGMLSVLIDRGAKLLEPFGIAEDSSITALCRVLMSSRGEASGVALATRVLAAYQHLNATERLSFFRHLAETLDPSVEAIELALQRYKDKPTGQALAALAQAAEAPRQELLRRLNQSPGGTAALVAMRAELLPLLREHPPLARIDYDFSHLLGSWFNRGFLQLQRITWSSPADVLEKIIDYEAVHQIPDWAELRRRLQPADRRCYAFFHPAMPGEPLVFVEVALSKDKADDISALLSDERQVLAATQANTAVFYSISNCQSGLRGVSFGNFLIKQVVAELLAELPNLKSFVTLSPVPGLVPWLRQQAEQNPSAAQLLALSQSDAVHAPEQAKPHSSLAAQLAAQYFLYAKRDDGSPLDPVARFHLGNGASLQNIHARANLSPAGLASSAGVMVNYHYDLSKIEEHHEAYAAKRQVNASRGVRALASGATKPSVETP